MLKLKRFILFTILILLAVVVIFTFITLKSLNWVKIPVYIVLYGVAFFFLSAACVRFAAEYKLEIEVLQDQLKEKRIKLKDAPQPTTWQDSRVEDLKSTLSSLSVQLKEQLQGQKQSGRQDTGLTSEIRDLFAVYSENEGVRDKEIQTIQSNYNTIAQNTNKAFTIADNLSTQAKSAFDLSGDVQEGVKVVNAVLYSAAEKSNKLFEQSKKISKIIEIISEISSKTHILSINASIVSARAGKDGKAFEVVSKEIRKLATETDNSLGEIETEIIKIQDIIRSVVQGINEANTKTIEEQDQLTAVIGALQGVTLGVEVLRAVSNVVNTKTVKQKELIEHVITDYRKILSEVNSVSNLQEGATVDIDLDGHLAQLDRILESLQLS